ncbi:RraA family protein [Pseudonocardia acaciae]|uniref:RraA family protein n=1 Tax=Pseudonocardia acaciae TaxID=551276 RepID=UPI0009FD20A7|nr:4-carboxy-4-hydroxy-2-oxoadipate aldolase/oxaloacetate decarboxylase [Pseudonocardia acaciae]
MADLVARLRAVDSCAVSDALDTLGRPGAVLGLAPVWPSGGTVVGRARTVVAGPRAGGGPGTHIASPVVDSAAPDDVIVIDNHGRTDVSCWGGLLAMAAARRGVAGVVVDGACRDVPDCVDAGLPVFSRAVVPVSARGRIVQRDMDVPIQVAGVLVSPGDLVVADRNGVVFVAAEGAGEVVELAERIVARERSMAEAVAAGRPVSEVMHDTRFPKVGQS